MIQTDLCGCNTDSIGIRRYCTIHDPLNQDRERMQEAFEATPEELGKAAVAAANPKDLIGAKKVSISKLPAVAVLHAAHAMMNGAEKFGSYNWRSNKVRAEIYIDAALRHIGAWNEREECASDSNVHHLGHAMACLAILLDAQETGNLVDDRPPKSKAYPEALSRLNELIGREK